MANYLIHHGVKGQSWGVQNGPPYPLDKSISTGKSLRKAIKPQLGSYMNDGKKGSKRDEVSDKYVKEYNNLLKKYGFDSEGMDGTEASWELEKRSGEKYLDSKLWNSFLDEYTNAALDDLNLKGNKEAEAFVKRHYSQDIEYLYDVVNAKSGKKVGEATYSPNLAKEYDKYEEWTKLANKRKI